MSGREVRERNTSRVSSRGQEENGVVLQRGVYRRRMLVSNRMLMSRGGGGCLAERDTGWEC